MEGFAGDRLEWSLWKKICLWWYYFNGFKSNSQSSFKLFTMKRKKHSSDPELVVFCDLSEKEHHRFNYVTPGVILEMNISVRFSFLLSTACAGWEELSPFKALSLSTRKKDQKWLDLFMVIHPLARLSSQSILNKVVFHSVLYASILESNFKSKS